MESAIDYFIKDIARINKITVPEASKKLDTCLKIISANENVEYSKLFNLLTVSALSSCLSKSCTSTQLAECEKLCHCVVFENKCVARYPPFASEINEDPDKFTLGMSTKDLEYLVKYISFLYYNFGSGLTDNAFDALEYILNKRLKLKGRRWEKIGAEPIEKLRVKLPFPMPSLQKLKPEMKELREYLNTEKITWSDKLDGVSGLVVYSKAKPDKPTSIYSRGDGEIGGDLTYLKDFIDFPELRTQFVESRSDSPELKQNLVVRGEFILPKKVWEEKYKGSYSNARSFVSAKINGGHVSPAFSDIHFVAYEIVYNSEANKPDQTFKILSALGFKTPVNGTFKNPLLFDLVSTYQKRRKESEYNIDGLVIQSSASADRQTNPPKAFKMLLEEQLRNTTVTNVEWNISRYGRYVPVAIYESVYIDGVRLHRASAHNADHVQTWSLGKGTKIKIARSGDVIPQIKDVTINPEISPIYPENKYPWHWERKDIILNEIETNPVVQVQRITHFFSILKVGQLGEGRVQKMFDSGLTTIEAITSANISDFKKIKGFGEVLSKMLHTNIHSVMQKTRLDRYLIAFTNFKTKIGRKLLKEITREYPEIFEHSETQIKEHLKKHKIAGIGAKRIEDLATGIPEFMKKLLELNRDDIKKAINYNKVFSKLTPNSKIKDKEFILTNFMNATDYDLEDYIWDNWGKIGNSVTSSTTAVIAKNLSIITPKMLDAIKFGIPVYTVEEFNDKFILVA